MLKTKKQKQKRNYLIYCCSVVNSCWTLCHPMDFSTPGFPVLHYLPEFAQIHEFAQTHIHWVGDAIQQFHPLSTPSPAFNLSQHQGIFQCQLFTSGGQIIGASASASVLPVNIQGRFPLWLTGLISLQSKGLSRVFSSTTVWKHHSYALSPLYGPTLISVHDYWKNHSFGYMDLSAKWCLCFLICYLQVCHSFSPKEHVF